MNTLCIRDVDNIRAKVSAGFTIRQIQQEYGIANYTTVSRFCKRHGISRFPEKVTQSESDDLVEALKFDGEGIPVREAWGEQSIYNCLSAMGVRVPRDTVRRSMHNRDAAGVARRKSHAIVRREYHAPHANYVWHTDTNMKLVRYGIWIYGTVDGFSRFLTHLVATDNISMHTGGLLHGRDILQWGVVPDLLRVDAGGENNIAMRLQLRLGGGVHVGSSTHNQPIERFWGTCRSHVTERYRVLFMRMEHDGDLNIADACDLDALRFAFLPAIQDECDIFRATHNHAHKGHRGGKPLILFNRAEPARTTDWDSEDFLLGHGTRLPFTVETLTERNRLVSTLAPDTLYKKYMTARAANKLLLEELLGF